MVNTGTDRRRHFTAPSCIQEPFDQMNSTSIVPFINMGLLLFAIAVGFATVKVYIEESRDILKRLETTLLNHEHRITRIEAFCQATHQKDDSDKQ